MPTPSGVAAAARARCRSATHFASRGWMMTITTASPISAGTMSLNALCGSVSSKIAPTRPPQTEAEPSRIRRRRWPPSSDRYPYTPLATPGTSPTLFDTFASTGG